MHCGATYESTLLQMNLRFHNGNEESRPAPASRVSWSDTKNCTSVSANFKLHVHGECDSTELVATIDGIVSSNSIHICVERLVAVQVQGTFYPNANNVGDGSVTKIACTDEFRQVEAHVKCVTTTQTPTTQTPTTQHPQHGTQIRSASDVPLELIGNGTLVNGVNGVIIRMLDGTVTAVATIDDALENVTHSGNLTLTPSNAKTSFGVTWSVHVNIYGVKGVQNTYPSYIQFLLPNNENTPPTSLEGFFDASVLIHNYTSSDPQVVSVDAQTGTVTLLANAPSQVVTLTQRTCEGTEAQHLVWTNLNPAVNDVDLATSTSPTGSSPSPCSPRPSPFTCMRTFIRL